MVLSVLTIVFTIFLVAVGVSTYRYIAYCHYGALSRPYFACRNFTLKVTVVQMMYSSIHWINHYSADKY